MRGNISKVEKSSDGGVWLCWDSSLCLQGRT